MRWKTSLIIDVVGQLFDYGEGCIDIQEDNPDTINLSDILARIKCSLGEMGDGIAELRDRISFILPSTEYDAKQAEAEIIRRPLPIDSSEMSIPLVRDLMDIIDTLEIRTRAINRLVKKSLRPI